MLENKSWMSNDDKILWQQALDDLDLNNLC
jgi:hypothetical protein